MSAESKYAGTTAVATGVLAVSVFADNVFYRRSADGPVEGGGELLERYPSIEAINGRGIDKRRDGGDGHVSIAHHDRPVLARAAYPGTSVPVQFPDRDLLHV